MFFGHLWQAQRLLIYCKRGGMRSQSVAKSLGPSKGWRYGKRWISGWSLGSWDFYIEDDHLPGNSHGSCLWWKWFLKRRGILPESPFRCVKYLKWNVKSPVRLSWLMFGWGHYEFAGKNLDKFTSNLFQLFWRWALQLKKSQVVGSEWNAIFVW